jgi:hypothetical protein
MASALGGDTAPWGDACGEGARGELSGSAAVGDRSPVDQGREANNGMVEETGSFEPSEWNEGNDHRVRLKL